MKKLVFAVVAACGVFGFAEAEDLTIPFGETYVLPETTNYANVVVHGTLNIPSGLKLTATNVALGPDEGDVAVINVLGTAADSLKVTGEVSIGENGGMGKIVALEKSSNVVLNIPILTVESSAAVASGSGYIDFLELGACVCDLKTFTNESTATARLIVDGGTLGKTANWNTTRFKGRFRIEGLTTTSAISIGGNYTKYRLNDGTLTIANCGNVNFTGSSDPGSDLQYKELYAGLTWENVGNLVLGIRQRVTAWSDDLLPYGVGCGIVEATKGDNWIRVENHCQHLNGLRLNGEVRGSAGGSLVFGEGDTDGVLAASVANVVKVEKVGSGTLTVDGESSVGTLKVSQGTLKVSSPLAVESIKVSEDAVLELDGQILNPGTADIRGQLVLKNGGRLLTTLDAETGIRDGGRCCPDVVEKTGLGTYILEDPVLMASNVHVKAGKLAFSAEGYACDLYKWNVTAWNNVGYIDGGNGAKKDEFYLGELAFVNPDGNRVGAGGIGTSSIGTAPGELAAGKAAFAAGSTLISAGGSGNAGALFDNNSNWPRVGVASPLTTDEGGVTLYVRLPTGSDPIVSINFSGCYGGFPKSWTLSGSMDGGKTWTLLNETTGYAVKDSTAAHWMGAADIGNPVPKEFPLVSADLAWTRPGVKNMPDVMSVQVDSGAVLDFSNVTGGQTINALTIDLEDGAGAISNCAFAAEGTVYVKNLGSDEKLNQLSIPLALGNAAGLENLANWGVVVNGVAMRPGRYKPTYKNGVLTFVGPGLMLILR